jgi:3-deoxy-manno-octulosonate cytidylyltransferase (CMP-KDO synthetase)
MGNGAIAVIPARFASTRFPGKPLAEIGGKAMLRHVYDNVLATGLFDKVIVATEDERIKIPAENWGAEVMMTSAHHPSGTDRCAEVVTRLKAAPDAIVVNIQGDEPFISRQPIQDLISQFRDTSVSIATLCQSGFLNEEISSPDCVKVVFATNGKALYFSRAVIPFVRDKSSALARLSPSHLEKAESLEQLRWMENGYDIYVRESDCRMCSVDTPKDLERAERFYWENS